MVKKNKNTIIRFFVGFLLFNLMGYNISAQIDTLFWFVAPHITKLHQDPGAGPVSFNIATFSHPVTVTIDVPANPSIPVITKNIVANSTDKITLWNNAYGATDYSPSYPTLRNSTVRAALEEGKWKATPGVTLPGNRGIRIRSTDSITVYYEIERPNNTELFSLKGQNAMGEEFFIPVQNNKNNQTFVLTDTAEYALSSVNISAVDEGTTIVVVYPPRNGNKIKGHESCVYPDSFQISLAKGQTYAFLPANYSYDKSKRLSGLRLKTKSGKRIIVVVTDDSVFGTVGNTGYDIVGDQLVPLENKLNGIVQQLIGDDYIIIKGPQAAVDIAYVVATKDATLVKVKDKNGVELSSTTIDKQQQLNIPMNQTVLIDADKPIVVMHTTGVYSGGGANHQEIGGAFIPSISMCTGSKKVGFIRGNTSGSKALYLSVLVRQGGEGDFKLSYYINATTKKEISLSGTSFQNIAGTKWAFALFSKADWGNDEIMSGMPCFIWNTSTIFHLGVNHGGSGGGNYGYFSNFNQIVPRASIDGSNAYKFCLGTPLQLSVTGGVSCVWSPSTYLSNPNILNPIATPPGKINYTAKIYGFCGDSALSSVTVLPKPTPEASFSVDYPSGCSPHKIRFYEHSKSAHNFYWDLDGNGTYELATLPDTTYQDLTNPENGFKDVFFNRFYSNNSNIPKNINVGLKVTRGGCADSLRQTITISPSLTPVISKSITSGCSPLTVNFQNLTTTSIDSVYYYWDFGDGGSSSSTNFPPANVNLNPSHVYINSSGVDKIYAVKLKVITKHGCEFYAYDNVVVHPALNSQFVVNKYTMCSPDSLLLTNQSTGVNLNYNWNFGDGDTKTTTSKTAFYKTYDEVDVPYSPVVSKNFTIQLSITDAVSGCAHNSSQTVTVNPGVVASFTTPDIMGISPYDVSLVNTSQTDIASTYFKWDFGDGTSSNDKNPVHQFTNSNPAGTVYTVVMSASNTYNCRDTAPPINVEVYSSIHAKISVTKTAGCSPFQIAIGNSSLGTNHKYTWDFGNGNTVVVNDKNPISQVYTVSSGLTTQQLFKIKLLVTDTVSGKTDIDMVNIFVYPPVSAGFTSVQKVNNCQPFEVDYTNTSSTSASIFKWEFSDGASSSSNSPIHIFHNITSGIIYPTTRLIAVSPYNCSDTTSYETYTINPEVFANLNIDTTFGCSPLRTTIQNASFNCDMYSWEYGDGTSDNSASAAINKIYFNNSLSTQIKTIRLIVENSVSHCKDTVEKAITVYPKPDVSFISDVSSGCQPLHVQFTNQSNRADLRFYWDFDDNNTSSILSPIHQFINSGTTSDLRNVELIGVTEFGCRDTFVSPITVMPYIKANFYVDTANSCTPLKLNVYNTSEGGNKFYWYLDNVLNKTVTTTTSFPYQFVNNTDILKEITIKLVAENTTYGNCTSTSTQVVKIYPRIRAVMLTSDTINCHPLKVDFSSALSMGATGPVPIKWDFDDGNNSVEAKPTHTFYNTGNADLVYTVSLLVTSQYQCTNRVTQKITVHPLVQALFDVDKTAGCPDLKVDFSNASTATANDFKWVFGDGATSTEKDPKHTFINNDPLTLVTDTVILTVKDNTHGGCSSTFSKVITTYPKPVAAFMPSEPIGCNPLTVDFSSATSKGATGQVPIKWDFGDGNNSLLANPSHVYYNSGKNDSVFSPIVTITSQYNCFATATTKVTVHPLIEAHFEVDKAFGCPDLGVQFTNSSTSTATDFDWNFGDAGSSVQKDPAHTFINNSPTVFVYNTVKLTVTDKLHGNCSNSYSKVITVYPKPSAAFTPSVSIGCQPLPVTFTNASQGTSLKNYWDFDENNSSMNQNPSFTFLNGGTTGMKDYNIKLKVVSKENCESSTSTKISVYPYLNAEFTLNEYAGCPPFDIVINNTTIGAIKYKWDFGDGTYSDLKNPAKEYPKLSTSSITQYAITLTVENSGCQQVYTKNVFIYPYVVTKFEPQSGCQPFKVGFNNLSQGYNLNYYWDFDDGGTSSVASPHYTFYNLGKTDVIRNVELSAVSEHGCSDVFKANDTIFANPDAEFELETNSSCSPFSVNIANTISGTSSYFWNFGDGQTKITSDPKVVHNYINTSENPKEYKITLVVTNNNSCKDTLVQPVNIYPSVKAVIGLLNEDTLRCNPAEMQLTNKTAASPKTEVTWDFGDLQTSMMNHPIHTFINESTESKYFKIRLTANSRYGCTHTDSALVNIIPSPAPDFIIDPWRQVFPNSTINISNTTNEGKWNFAWNFGDGKGLHEGAYLTYTYDKEGDPVDEFKYYVTLYAQNKYCKDSITKTIQVLPHKPIALIEKDIIAGCPPLKVNFSNISLYDHKGGIWNFGDSSYSSNVDVAKIYTIPGIYDVKLTVEGYGGTHDTSTTIEVYEQPIASFETPTPVVYIYEDEAIFRNLSSFADMYTWDFGDNTYSSEFEPKHIYYTEGIYNVNLEVQNTDGCKDSITIVSAVKAESACTMRFPNTFFPLLDGQVDGHYPENDKNDNIFHPYFREGILEDTYQLEIFDRWGESIFITNDIGFGWNGYYKNKLVQQGVYVYKVSYRCTSQSTKTVLNSITLLHNK